MLIGEFVGAVMKELEPFLTPENGVTFSISVIACDHTLLRTGEKVFGVGMATNPFDDKFDRHNIQFTLFAKKGRKGHETDQAKGEICVHN